MHRKSKMGWAWALHSKWGHVPRSCSLCFRHVSCRLTYRRLSPFMKFYITSYSARVHGPFIRVVRSPAAPWHRDPRRVALVNLAASIADNPACRTLVTWCCCSCCPVVTNSQIVLMFCWLSPTPQLSLRVLPVSSHLCRLVSEVYKLLENESTCDTNSYFSCWANSTSDTAI